MRPIAKKVLAVLSSLRLSSALLVLLALLTWLGTLEQVEHGLYQVQRKYFESFFLVHRAGAVPIPLPGANLVLCVLACNLLLGGMIRLRKGAATAGVFVAHIGIALLLVSGFVKTYYSSEGHVTLFEGQRSPFFQSYVRWELAVLEDLGDGRVREHVAPEEAFLGAAQGRKARIDSQSLPFSVELGPLFQNCRPLPKGPMFTVDVPVIDGVFLRPAALDTAAEANLAGAYASVLSRDGTRQEGILWGASAAPWTVEVGGRRYGLELRRERYSMPFTLALSDFRKEDHPGTAMPRSFESDVRVLAGTTDREVTISMNQPLRDGGLVVYQASWGPSNARPGDALFSTFAVVENPADRIPLVACIVIALGLLGHFSRKLTRHVRAEARRA